MTSGPELPAARLVIRVIGVEDAARLQAVYAAAPDSLGALPADAALRELRQSQAQPGRAVALLTLHDGTDVGAIGWWPGKPEPGIALLGALVIATPHRGQGYAREALRALEGRLAGEGVTQLRTAIPYRRLAAVRGAILALGFTEMPIAEHTRMGVAGAGISLWAKPIA